MRNPLILGVALAVAVSVPSAMPAQEYQSGQLWTVATWEINPPDVATLEGVGEKIAKAAELGGWARSTVGRSGTTSTPTPWFPSSTKASWPTHSYG